MVDRSPAERAHVLDALIRRSAEAVNNGDLDGARRLALQVLEEDSDNLDAATLLATERQPQGQVRRITVMFCDLVGSTALSGKLDPELYRSVLNRYRRLATEIIEERHGGHLASVKGDGLLALFGHPAAHANDTERAVQSGLDIAAAVQELSDAVSDAIGSPLAVRGAVHRGLLYIDPEQDDVYGLPANVAARLQELAAIGTVVVSADVQRLVGDLFETEAGEPTLVKGVDEPIQPFTVLGRRITSEARGITTPLIGRGDELARMREVWEEARTGTSAVVLGIALVGDAGIGKTRVAATFAAEVAIGGGTVVQLGGSADHSDIGLHPLRMLIEGRCGIVRDTPTHERVRRLGDELGRLDFDVEDALPLLAPVLALDPESGYSMVPAEGRKLSDDIAKASAEYVLACLGSGPAMLVVEDHHALDDATKELVNRLLRSGRDQTVLVVTTRGKPPHRTELLELGPLGREACLALVDAIAPPTSATQARNSLIDRSDGVPLYLEELVRSSGLEVVDPVHRPARSEASTVPDVLYEPLMARLRSAPDGGAVAGAAATIGRTVELDLLASVLEVTRTELDETIAGLASTGLLERVADADAVRFRHELLREVAYDVLPPARRRDLHARTADLLADGAGDRAVDWPAIAFHLQRAGRDLEAADALEQASETARRRGDLNEAKLHLTRAVDLLALAPAGPARDRLEVRLRLRRGVLAVNADGMAGLNTAIDYERCMELCLEGAWTGEMISTITCMWSFYCARADIPRARMCSEMLRRLVTDEFSFWEPQNIASFAMLDFFAGEFTTAAQELERSILQLEATDGAAAEAVKAWYIPTHPTVAMRVHLGYARFTQGDTVGADAEVAKALELARRLEFPQGPVSECYCHWLSVSMYIERQAWDQALAAATTMQTVGTEFGIDSWAMMGMMFGTTIAGARSVFEGHPAGLAEVQGTSMLLASLEMGELYALITTYQTLLGSLHASTGDRDTARDRFQASLDMAERTGQHGADAETLRCLAHLNDDVASLTTGLHAALDLARRQGGRHLELRIAVDLHDIRGDRSFEDLRRAVEGFLPSSSYPLLDEARARVQRAG